MLEYIDNKNILNIYYDIRRKVFIEEYKVPEPLEYIYEEDAFNYIYKVDNNYVGGLRYRILDEKTILLERICVLKEYRNKGYGTKILLNIIEIIKSKYNNKYDITLNSFIENIDYYKALNFTINGDIFINLDREFINLKYIS